MFSDVEFARDVALCAKHLEGQAPHQQILHRLLKDLLNEKASKEHGFYLGITTVKSIGKGKNNSSNNDDDDDNDENHQGPVLTFPVSFTCRMFLPVRGEIMQGTVNRVLGSGAFIMSGPLRYAYLSSVKMPRYRYVPSEEGEEEEKPCFLRDDLSKIAVGVVVRFEVMAVRFKEREDKRRDDFYVLASLDGDDTLGPVSLAGSDEPYM